MAVCLWGWSSHPEDAGWAENLCLYGMISSALERITHPFKKFHSAYSCFKYIFNSINRYLLMAEYIAGTILGVGDIRVNISDTERDRP